MRKERAREMRRAAILSAQAATNSQAASMSSLYPLWAEDTPYGGAGQPQIVRWPERELYRCAQAHTSQVGWEPGAVPALWVQINEDHAGTIQDPIPAARGMEYTFGLHYRDPEVNKVYLCCRVGEAEGGKIVLQYLPHEVVKQYFEEAAA